MPPLSRLSSWITLIPYGVLGETMIQCVKITRPDVADTSKVAVAVARAQAPSNTSTLPVVAFAGKHSPSPLSTAFLAHITLRFGPSFCETVATGGPCTSHCDAQAECGEFAAAENITCPLNVCCSQFGFCGTTDEFCGSGCQSNCNPPGQFSCGDDQQTALHRRIGYYEGWAVQSSSRACDSYPPESISAETFTHINFAFALISNNFEIMEMSPGDSALWVRTTNLKQRNAALKVFLSIGGWKFNDPPSQNIFSNLVGSAESTNTFIASALNILQTYGFDGIDVDWEYPVANDRGGAPEDKSNFPIFMAKVKAAFASHGYGLTFTAPSSYWYLQHFDLPALLESADWVNVMTYDLHGTWDGNDPYIGKVVLAHTNLTEIQQTMQLFANVGISPSSMVLGIGFYGRSFQLASSHCTTPGCAFIGGAAAGICSLNSGTLMFAEIETIITQLSLEPVLVEADAIKYIVWNDDQWVSYDDTQTLQMKLDYANSICLGGTMIWSVDQDDSSFTALHGLYSDVNINAPSSIDSGNQCQITGCGQGCPDKYESLTTLTQNPSLTSSCDPKNPARLCCPIGNAPQSCFWRGGGGQVCNAQCNVGEIVMALDEVGDGSTPTCVQGYKALCCQSGQGDIGDCFGTGCGENECVSNYEVQTFVKQGSADNGGCEANQAPPVAPHDVIGYTDCHWTGDVPGCFNAVCSPGQVAVYAGFLPVPEDWVFPQFSPINGEGISETATFTVDFDDNIGPADSSSFGAGSSGESDDGDENDSPFGEVFISSPNPSSVSSVSIESDWVLTDCLRSSDQPQTVLAYCSKPMDDTESGCGHVFIGNAKHTIVRMPKSCGLGPYARIKSFEIHPDQTVLSPVHMKKKPVSEPVYSFSFDYQFSVIPPENGPIMMRADMTDMPGYWECRDAMVNSPPEDTTTRRKRDYHKPTELEKRWFGPFDSWLQRLNTLSTGDGSERNFHWSDTYTIFHQEEQCPNFSSSLDISVSGSASITSAFGYYLEATIIPPAIQECYVYFKAGMAEAHYDTERAEIASFGFPGLYYPGLLTLGPSLHLYAQITGQLSMGGRFSASVGYQFSEVDISLGKKDRNSNEDNPPTSSNSEGNNQGVDYALAANVNLDGNVEVPSLQLGLSVLGGAVMDAQVFVEADLYAGLSVNGSVSSTSAAKICVNPHYGVNLNIGLTGSVLFWESNPQSYNVYNADFDFADKCFTSFTEPHTSENTLKRSETGYHDKQIKYAGHVVARTTALHSPEPAYIEHKSVTSRSTYRRDLEMPLNSWSIKDHPKNLSKLEKRGGVPFLPGNIGCPTINDQINDGLKGKDCSIYSNDPTDLDPNQLADRVARRAQQATPHLTNSSQSHFHDFVEGSQVSSCNVQIPIPAYQNTPVTAYYDLASPGTLSPAFKDYTPVPPVSLGTTAKGQPRLTTAKGAPVYAREHVYEESLAGLFVDYLEQSQGLWLNSEQDNDWCNWVEQNLRSLPIPAYFDNPLENPNSQSVFTLLGNCYPQNGIDFMPILEQEANKAKNLAMYDGERRLNNLGTKQFRDISNTDWTNKCPSAKVALLRSAAGVISYMNAFPIKQDFLRVNRCIRQVWASWYPLYSASNVDAPDKGNIDVPKLYDNWIHTIVAGMAPWLKSEVDRIIPSVLDPADVFLSFNNAVDNFALTQQIPQGITFTEDVGITHTILSAQIANQIGNINWLSSLPAH
ncbi:hypothetical protein BDZ94DRAFT_1307367 [Collybia nuda]|uniref:Chitinase n=1 Tax=Collybia nuda TaxID=64659 RepID=A0A9P5Y7X5_9AGAR|nr:hypothetical protein BDZ94DRAFT_1307367 [Collybia nuda]